MNVKAADEQITTIRDAIAAGHGQGFLISLLSGRLAAFISLIIAGFVALVLSVVLLTNTDSPNAGSIVTILGIIGGGTAGLGNLTSIFHTFIASKAAATAPGISSSANQSIGAP